MLRVARTVTRESNHNRPLPTRFQQFARPARVHPLISSRIARARNLVSSSRSRSEINTIDSGSLATFRTRNTPTHRSGALKNLPFLGGVSHLY